MSDTQWLEKLAEGTIAEDSALVDGCTLEQAVMDVKAEGFPVEETRAWDKLVTRALTTSTLVTVGHLRVLNPRLAEHYLELDSQAIKDSVHVAARKYATVGDWVFSKSGGECGRVDEVISTGSPHYDAVRTEYINRYGLDQVSLHEHATALYRVVHADGAKELYYDTETTVEPTNPSHLAGMTLAHTPEAVDTGVLKSAVSLWWSLLPESEKQGVFAQAGSTLDLLPRITAKFARSTVDELGVWHPLLGTAYKHTQANSKNNATRKKANDRGIVCPNCGGDHINYAFGDKLNKCLSCHFAFDSDEGDYDVEASRKQANSMTQAPYTVNDNVKKDMIKKRKEQENDPEIIADKALWEEHRKRKEKSASRKQAGPMFCSEMGCNRSSHDIGSADGKPYCPVHLPEEDFQKSS
jgi:hypothetical protein